MHVIAFLVCLAGCILIARTLPWFIARPFLHVPPGAELDRKLDPRRNLVRCGFGLVLVLLALFLLLAAGSNRDNTPLDYLALDITISGVVYMGWGVYFSATSAFGDRLNSRLVAPEGDPDPWKTGYAYQMAAAQTIGAVYGSGAILLVLGLLLQAAT